MSKSGHQLKSKITHEMSQVEVTRTDSPTAHATETTHSKLVKHSSDERTTPSSSATTIVPETASVSVVSDNPPVSVSNPISVVSKNPTVPNNPTVPDNPIVPNNPTVPDNPIVPNNPTVPVNQTVPVVPNNPIVSTTPTKPLEKSASYETKEKVTNVKPEDDDDGDFKNDESDTKKYKQMGLVDECDVNEMESVLRDNPKLKEIFKSSDDLIHALKVISLIRPNEKFSTSAGIFIQSEIQNPIRVSDWIRQYTQPLWLIRMRNGDDRITNLKAIKAIFVGALVVVDDALQEHENLSGRDSQTRVDLVKKMKNEQLINRMADAITKAMNSLENLKQTYSGDANACARIDMLRETIKDRSTLIKTSLDFLK